MKLLLIYFVVVMLLAWWPWNVRLILVAATRIPVRSSRPPQDVFALSGGSLMSNVRNRHRTAVVLFAVAVIIAALVASVTTIEQVDRRTANGGKGIP